MKQKLTGLKFVHIMLTGVEKISPTNAALALMTPKYDFSIEVAVHGVRECAMRMKSA